MGRWKGATFKEYIHEAPHLFRRHVHQHEEKVLFREHCWGAYHDVTEETIARDYNVAVSAA